MSSTTLLEYLMQRNPVVELVNRHDSASAYPKKSTQNHKWPHIKTVRRWKDFRWKHIQDLFNGQLNDALKTAMSALQDFSHIEDESRRIYNENTLEGLIQKSNHRILHEALDKMPETLLHQRVRMLRGSQAKMVHRENEKDCPDWAGTNSRQGEHNILPGDTKTSWTWESSDLNKYLGISNLGDQGFGGALWPVRQLAWYCKCSFARYGYIITDKELVVLRMGSEEGINVSENEVCHDSTIGDGLQDNAVVEYFSIPWENGRASRALTINLSLWILHVLAANNGHLSNGPYPPLQTEVLTAPQHQRVLQSDPLKPKKIASASFEHEELSQPQGKECIDQAETEGRSPSITDESVGGTDVGVVSQQPSFSIPNISMQLNKRRQPGRETGSGPARSDLTSMDFRNPNVVIETRAAKRRAQQARERNKRRTEFQSLGRDETPPRKARSRRKK